MEHFNLRQVFAIKETRRSQGKGKDCLGVLLCNQDVILALVPFFDDF